MARKRTVPKPKPETVQSRTGAAAVALPDEVLGSLKKAVQRGRWLVAVFSIDNGQIMLDRTATDWPAADVDKAITLLAQNIRPLRGEDA